MTKEELYSRFTWDTGWVIRQESLNEFFKDKVIIQKGSNRHPCADVLHEWIEGAEIQALENAHWYDEAMVKDKFDLEAYRIKPQEPVYEWQWYKVENKEIIEWTVHWRTDDEMKESSYNKQQWYKAEATKRERK